MCTIAVKLKFDCTRVQTHKGGDEVSISTRRLESVSSFLPDVIEAVLKGVQAESAILDGDLVAV
jgi:DNA ligase-1